MKDKLVCLCEMSACHKFWYNIEILKKIKMWRGVKMTEFIERTKSKREVLQTTVGIIVLQNDDIKAELSNPS